MITHLLHSIWGHKFSNMLLFILLTATAIVMMQSVSGTLEKIWYYTAPRGYITENVGALYIESKAENQKEDSIMNAKLFQNLQVNPYLSDISFGNMKLIYEGNEKYNMVGAQGKTFDAYHRYADDHTAPVMGIKVLSGRWFTESDAHSNVVIVSPEAAKQLFGATQVTNRTFNYQEKEYRVIGVCNSIRQSKKTQATPTIFFYNREHSGFLLKIKPDQEENFARSVESIVRSVFGTNNYIINYETLDQADHIMNRANNSRLRIFLKTKLFMIVVTVFSLIAVLWYMIDKRREELGIRFVLGRTLPQLIAYILYENYLLFISSFLIALFVVFNFQYAGVELLSNEHIGISILLSFLFMIFLTTIGALIPCLKIRKLQITEIIKNE